MGQFSKYSQALVQGKKQEEMSKSCWLIFEHTQLLGRLAGNVGWENSFTSDNVFLSHEDFPSSIFPVYTCISVPCCFHQRPPPVPSQQLHKRFLPPSLVQNLLLSMPCLALLLLLNHPWLLTSYYFILSHSPSHLVSSHRLLNIHLIFAFNCFLFCYIL